MGGEELWVALHVEVTVELADAVANFLFEEGAPGVITEDRAGSTHVESAVPAARATAVQRALERYLAGLAATHDLPSLPLITSSPVPAVDWVALARRHHRPLLVGRRLLVAPPWDAPRVPGRETLVIEPGMAFGTGQHATTRGCLEAIEEIVAERPVASALDVGTGSGVLALALARLGVERVVAIDNDPGVLPIARATLTRNEVRGVDLVAGGPAAVRARFDLVVANLLADTLVAEAAALAATVAPGGHLVVSGILTAQVGSVRGAYPAWDIVRIRAEEPWQTLTLTRS